MTARSDALGTCLLVVSDNRLLAEATGAALQAREVVTLFDHVAPRDEMEYWNRTTREPQVLLLDFDGHAPDQLFAKIRRLVGDLSETQVAVVGYDTSEQLAAGCIEAGANGFISKTHSIDDLVAAVEALKQGRSFCSPAIAQAVLVRIRELAGAKAARTNNSDADLTDREVEILQLVDDGLLNKEIAKRLGIAVSTVKNHLHSTFEKLSVESRREAVQQALALGVLQCQGEHATA